MPNASLRTVFTAAILLVSPFAVQAVEIIQGPTLTMNPTGLTPLAGVVELETDTPVQAQLTITDGLDLWIVNFPDALQVHYLPVLGLKAGRSYTVTVDLIPGGFAGNLMAVTAALPAEFPVVQVLVSDPLRMEPGFTLIDCFRRDQGDMRPVYSLVVDSAGDVVWYSSICASALQQTINGNLFYRGGSELYEADMLGNFKLQLLLDVSPTGGLHHDHQRTPMGTFLSLSRESVQVLDFPTSELDPDAPTQETTVRDEPVVEFLPDGTLRNEWFLTDIIQPTRIGYSSLNTTAQGVDWAHTNAVVYDPGDDSIIVSARHQDAVFKFSRATGDLVWILGPPDNWAPEFQPFLLNPIGSPFRWQYHQHAPMITGDGNIVLFDNGNARASPFDGNTPVADIDNFSRGVEYEINEQAMTVRQVWEYGENTREQLFSGFICDADWLETTGNVLMTFGAVSFAGGISSADIGLGTLHARIVEATEDVVPDTVFDIRLYDSAGGRITVYRSERLQSLYPQQFVKAPNGVGNTLTADKISGSAVFAWAASRVDAAHDAADYYMLYTSSSPNSDFAMLDSVDQTNLAAGNGAALEFYKIVAGNSAGTSGDEPPLP